MLELYTDATPNGLKVSVCLEELGLQYNVNRVFLGGDQMTPEFTKLNPNNKIPVLVDDGFVLTESNAILIYLAEKHGKLLPQDGKLRARLVESMMFQAASVGPMFGQLMVFAGAWQNEFPKVTGRYVKEPGDLLYITGDTLWFSGTEEVSRRFSPKVVILFTGAAEPKGRFHMTMGSEDALEAAAAFPEAALLSVHNEGWGHLKEDQDQLAHVFATFNLADRLVRFDKGQPLSFSV